MRSTASVKVAYGQLSTNLRLSSEEEFRAPMVMLVDDFVYPAVDVEEHPDSGGCLLLKASRGLFV